MQVFGQPASTDVARVLTCLFEKDLEFELVRIDNFKREHKLPEFIKLRVRAYMRLASPPHPHVQSGFRISLYS